MLLQDKKNLGIAPELFQAIGEKTRLSVVQLLLEQELGVEDIKSRLNISESLLSKHLKVLKDCGLIQSRKEGRFVYYQVVPKIRVRGSRQSLQLPCCKIKLLNSKMK